MKDSERERIKLRATYLNGLGLVFAGAGGVGPAIVLAYRPGMPWSVVGIAGMMIFVGIICSLECHWLALRHLDKLDAE